MIIWKRQKNHFGHIAYVGYIGKVIAFKFRYDDLRPRGDTRPPWILYFFLPSIDEKCKNRFYQKEFGEVKILCEKILSRWMRMAGMRKIKRR